MDSTGPAVCLDKFDQPFVVRDYRAEDRAALHAMYDAFEPKRVAQGLPPEDPAQRGNWLDRVLEDGRHLVVEVEGAIVGHGMLLPIEEDAAELANFLHQDVRDRGIGTTLNRALLAAGKSRGFRRV